MGFIKSPVAVTSRESSKVSRVNDMFPQDAVKRALMHVFSHLVAVSEAPLSQTYCVRADPINRDMYKTCHS